MCNGCRPAPFAAYEFAPAAALIRTGSALELVLSVGTVAKRLRNAPRALYAIESRAFRAQEYKDQQSANHAARSRVRASTSILPRADSLARASQSRAREGHNHLCSCSVHIARSRRGVRVPRLRQGVRHVRVITRHLPFSRSRFLSTPSSLLLSKKAQ